MKFIIQQKRTGKYYNSTGIPSDWTNKREAASTFTEYRHENRQVILPESIASDGLAAHCLKSLSPNYGKCIAIKIN